MKIVLIGAGSHFGWTLSRDILALSALQDATLGLCDIDADKLDLTARYVRATIEKHGLPARVETSLDRRVLLDGADFVVTSVAVGGPAYAGAPYAWEVEVPRRYGLDQSVADTLGVGGVFRFLRTAPVQLAVCQDMIELCPNALLLNYTNPMCMLTWLHASTGVRQVGLCHSVQNTERELCGYLGLETSAVRSWVAGINHQAWFLDFRLKDGSCLQSRLRTCLESPEIVARDTVRFEMLRHFGYFVTESTRHNSEYLPYFRRTAELRQRFHLETREVPALPRTIRERMPDRFDAQGQVIPGQLDVSHEFAARIIEAEVTGQPFRFNGNVMNDLGCTAGALIPNLPSNCCVEVPCFADAHGVHPTPTGPLPPACAALNRTNVNVQELAVESFLRRDPDLAFQACALDPLTAAVLPLHEIRAMFDELWKLESNAGLLDSFPSP